MTMMNFQEGFAQVCVGNPHDGGKWGLIDITGKEIIPFGKYDSVGPFKNGFARMARDGKCGLLALNATPTPALVEPTSPTAYASTQSVLVDGAPVEFQCCVLKDAKGNDTNYIKLRDLGAALGFLVDWTAEKGIFIETK